MLLLAQNALKGMDLAGVTGIVRGMVQSVSREGCTRTLIDNHMIQF